MDRPNAMASSEGEGHENFLSSILLDVRGYCTANPNAIVAKSETSSGHPIEVAFCTARAPAISHFSVHCPDLQLPPADLSLAPKVIATDADLVLLRVPINRLGRYFHEHNDYFVYRAHNHSPKLDLIPPPRAPFGDNEVAILSCGTAAEDSNKQYIVAALRPLHGFTFTLHLYRSKPGGETGSWTFQSVSVEEPLREKVCPVPDTAERLMYHLTTKVITLGGAKGTVGWVDLWRGILLCNVLEQSPMLRDMPLPLPASGNRGHFLIGCERLYRDITVSQRRDFIKYVEMEIFPPRMVASTASGNPDSDSLEWLHHRSYAPQLTYSLVPGSWVVNTWSMPIPVTSWDDWRCTAELDDLPVDDPNHYDLLHELISSISDKEAKEATLSLGGLSMAYPTFSLDDDVVYLLTKAAGRGNRRLVVAVDVCRKKLQGVDKLDGRRNTSCVPYYITSEISRYLKTGTCAPCCDECSGCHLCQPSMIKMGIPHINCEPEVTTTYPSVNVEASMKVVNNHLEKMAEAAPAPAEKVAAPAKKAAPPAPAEKAAPPAPAEKAAPVPAKDVSGRNYASIDMPESTLPALPVKPKPSPRQKAAQNALVAATSSPKPAHANDAPTEPGYSIFVKNLPYNATVEMIEQEFRKFGSIKSGGIQVRNRQTDRFCYGFVEFESQHSMQKALEAHTVYVGSREAYIQEKITPRVVNGNAGGSRFLGEGFANNGNYQDSHNRYRNQNVYSGRGLGQQGNGYHKASGYHQTANGRI